MVIPFIESLAFVYAFVMEGFVACIGSIVLPALRITGMPAFGDVAGRVRCAEGAMKTLVSAIGLTALCLGWLSLPAQGQSAKPASEDAPAAVPEKRQANLVDRVNQLQHRLEQIKAELAAAKLRLADASGTPPTLTGASQQVADLEKGVERAKFELYSIEADLVQAQLDSTKLMMQTTADEETLLPQSFTATRVAGPRPRPGLSVVLTNDHGPFIRGRNNFCLEFKNARDGSAADAGDVRVDFTDSIGRIKAVRAVVRLAHSEVGRYCGQVTLPAAGEWLVTTAYDGPSGKGRAIFAPAVK